MDKILREMKNPFAEKEAGEKLLKARAEMSFAERMKNEREKIAKLIEKGELANDKLGLGQEVEKLADYVLKNTKTELRKMSLEQVEELKNKFDLPYDSEVLLLAAQELYNRRTIH